MLQVSWKENVKMCLSLEMTPLKLDSNDIKTAFITFANSIICNIKWKWIICHLWLLGSTWKSLHQFWVGGKRSETDQEKFIWCTPNGSQELKNDTIQWQNGQPDNLGGNQNCLHLRILTNVSQAVLSDRSCSQLYPYACQV